MTPIHDSHAEMATIAGCLLSRDVAMDVLDVVKPGDFYVPRHEIILNAIARLLDEGALTDVVTVGDYLIRNNEINQAGGLDYLHSITSAVAVANQAPFHAEIVRDKAARRRVVEAATTTLMNAETMALPALIETARQSIDNAERTDRRSLVYVGDLIEEVVEQAQSPRRIYPSPWRGLNDTLGGGFRPGALYVLAARPGLGKTAIALQIASRLAMQGPVSFSSLEMPREELVRRIISQGSEIPHHLLELGKEIPLFWRERIDTWRMSTAAHAIAIDDRSTVMMSDVRSQARAVQRPSGKVAGVVVDYLQLMSGPPGDKRIDVVSENARQAKLLARELDCPVILLSQLNRESERRTDKRPQLSDLRDSGAIEQDADVVMMLYRDPNWEPANPAQIAGPLPLELNVAKNRHGPPLMHTLKWEGSQMRAFE
jgi:replicative DNA helicase